MTLIAFFLGFACCAALVSRNLQITRGNRCAENRDSKVTTDTHLRQNGVENFGGTKSGIGATPVDSHVPQ